VAVSASPQTILFIPNLLPRPRPSKNARLGTQPYQFGMPGTNFF
jgi:hypothetical protein